MLEKCIDCGSETSVVDSRLKPDGSIMKRRKCTNCGYTFRTTEIEECMLENSELGYELLELKKIMKLLDDKIANINKIINWR